MGQVAGWGTTHTKSDMFVPFKAKNECEIPETHRHSNIISICISCEGYILFSNVPA